MWQVGGLAAGSPPDTDRAAWAWAWAQAGAAGGGRLAAAPMPVPSSPSSAGTGPQLRRKGGRYRCAPLAGRQQMLSMQGDTI